MSKAHTSLTLYENSALQQVELSDTKYSIVEQCLRKSFHLLTIQCGLKCLGQHGLGILEVLRRARPRMESTVQAHLLQNVNIVVQLKCVIKVENIL